MGKTITTMTFEETITKNKGAIFSNCGGYRYFLWRRWKAEKAVTFVGLNPSIANAYTSDPTLTRCIGFAKYWGFGALYLVNLFAYISRDSNKLLKNENPIGPLNNCWLKSVAKESDLIIAAWGNKGKYLNRSKEVKLFFQKMYALKINSSGEPAHPLYLPKFITPTPF